MKLLASLVFRMMLFGFILSVNKIHYILYAPVSVSKFQNIFLIGKVLFYELYILYIIIYYNI